MAKKNIVVLPAATVRKIIRRHTAEWRKKIDATHAGYVLAYRIAVSPAGHKENAPLAYGRAQGIEAAAKILGIELGRPEIFEIARDSGA